MGCQCAKSEETGQMIIDKSPQKNVSEQDQQNPQMSNVQSKARLDSADVSKLSASHINNNDSSKIVKKKKKAKKTENNFNLEFLEALNNLRQNPQLFADKVIAAISYIKEEDGKQIFELPNGSKIALNKGEEAFRDCAEKLRNNIPNLPPFVLKPELTVPIPEASADWKKNDLIANALNLVKENNKSSYSDFLFNLDLGVSDPELSVVLQVVDDSNFKGRRSQNLLSKDLKYVGISHASKGKKSFCVYVVFAK